MDLTKIRMSFECPRCKHFHKHFAAGGTTFKPTVLCVACTSQFRAKLNTKGALFVGAIIALLLMLFIAATALRANFGFSARASWMTPAFVALWLSSVALTSLIWWRYTERFFEYVPVEANAA